MPMPVTTTRFMEDPANSLVPGKVNPSRLEAGQG